MSEVLPVPPRVTVATIVQAVSAEFGVSERELLSERRMQRSTVPRHAVMALAREMTPHTLSTIGRAIRRDHTSVHYGIQRHEARLAADPEYAAHIRAVSERLQRSMSDA